MIESTAAIDENAHWVDALTGIGLGDEARAPAPDLALFFASPLYPDLPNLVDQAFRRSAASVMVGCSGHGVIGLSREVEGGPALSLLNLMLPGTELYPKHIEQEEVAGLRSPAQWREWLGAPADRVNACLVFSDPFTLDTEDLINSLAAAYPDRPIMGGLASGMPERRGTWLFLNDEVYRSGAVVVGIGGAYTLRAVVAQGAMPIGRPWTVTAVQRNVIQTLGGRPALDVLHETLESLPADLRQRASRNLLTGLAMDEGKEQLAQGDFVIRNLVGVDPDAKAIAIGAMPQVGETLQFQIRDADAADEDLRRQLAAAREHLGTTEVPGALLCTCNGRGVGLFGTADHDAKAVAESLGTVPLAGFFCNGEIGPVGGKVYLHGFTASLALFVP
ncbi:MAG TPA: FIST N-terminal domain-containing protein, partial [Chloroflexota bacterium]